MGRPELPLDPATGPVAAFASDLRALRARAGTPSYRALSSRTHYSVTTLSQAAAGRTAPSLPVLRAFVEACGGDPQEWEDRWRALMTDVEDGSPPAEPSPVATDPPQPTPDPAPVRVARRWPLVAAVLVSLTIGVAATVLVTRVDRLAWPWTHGGAGAVDPVADGSDPNRAGCGPGAVTLIAVPVSFPDAVPAGQLELRYSPRCRAAWSRFEPAASWHPGDGTVVTVWTIRPADQSTFSYTVTFGGVSIIGDMLMTARGCIAVEVTMVRATKTSPVASTACQPIDE